MDYSSHSQLFLEAPSSVAGVKGAIFIIKDTC